VAVSDEETMEEGWDEVGNQFRALGESLSRAFRTAWQREENRRHLRDVQDGLSAMADQVGQAVREAAESPGGQKVRREVERAAESARVAGEQALQEARPQLLAALQRVNAELQKVIDRLEEEPLGDGPEA
jgi:uncharacterized membrane protein YccC